MQRRKGEGDIGANRIRAIVWKFLHDIADIIHDIGVVSRSAVQGVCAQPTIERVITPRAHEQVLAIVANEDIVLLVANRHQGAGSAAYGIQKGDIFDIGVISEVDAEIGLDRVVALTVQLPHLIVRPVDDIGVVAAPADHRINAQSAIERVIAIPALKPVIRLIASQKVVARAANGVFNEGSDVLKAGCGIPIEIGVAYIAGENGVGSRIMRQQIFGERAEVSRPQINFQICAEITEVIGIVATAIPEYGEKGIQNFTRRSCDRGGFVLLHAVDKLHPGDWIPFIDGCAGVAVKVCAM